METDQNIVTKHVKMKKSKEQKNNVKKILTSQLPTNEKITNKVTKEEGETTYDLKKREKRKLVKNGSVDAVKTKIEKQNIPNKEKQNMPNKEKQNIPNKEKQNIPNKEKQNNLKSKGINQKNLLICKKEKKGEKKKKIMMENIRNENNNEQNKTNLIDTECLWTDLFISKPLLKCLFELKFNHPTIIQKDVIPLALEGKSILANSETGSGKTLAFVLPILERLLQSPNIRLRNGNVKSMNVTKSLILLPTRELALQCHDVVKSMTKYVPITYSLFCGGLDIKQQESEYKKKNDIFICTPGRILDLLLNYSNGFVDFLEIVVFDEADKLLELGFKEECLKVLEVCKFKKQILFFSATLTKDIKELAQFSLKNPIFIQSEQKDQSAVESENNNDSSINNNSNKKGIKAFKISENLNQEFLNITQEKYRKCVLLHLCSTIFKSNTIIFFNTRKEAHYMYLILTFLKFKCTELHGGLTQKKRIENICEFKKKDVDLLLTTDLASRGLDITHVQCVINYNVPSNVIKYVHRIGRTARIGKKGTSCTFYLPCEKDHVKKMIKGIRKNKNCVILKRNVAKEHILHWECILNKNKDAIKSMVEQEKVEREIQKSEKYIDKIKNIILYKEEIMNRPKRVWFMTPTEKLQLRKNAFEKEQQLKDGINEHIHRNDSSKKQNKAKKHENKKKQERNGYNNNLDGDKSGNIEKKENESVQNLKKILKELKVNILHGKDKKKDKSKLRKNKDMDFDLQKKQNYVVKKDIRKAKKEAKQRNKMLTKKKNKKKSNNK